MGFLGVEGVAGFELPVCDGLVAGILGFFAMFFYLAAVIERPAKMDLKKKHVLVTGLVGGRD